MPIKRNIMKKGHGILSLFKCMRKKDQMIAGTKKKRGHQSRLQQQIDKIIDRTAGRSEKFKGGGK